MQISISARAKLCKIRRGISIEASSGEALSKKKQIEDSGLGLLHPNTHPSTTSK